MKIQDVKVLTVDYKKIIDFLYMPLNENENLVINRFSVFENLFAIDTDCCFSEIKYVPINDEIRPIIEVECRIKRLTENGYTIRIDKPDFIKIIPLEEYLKMSKEVYLTDFIRYNYNPRIEQNQKLLMRYINKTTNSK